MANPIAGQTPASIPEPETDSERAVLRKVLGASFIGNFVEWFDYAVYGYLATVIARVFFRDRAPGH